MIKKMDEQKAQSRMWGSSTHCSTAFQRWAEEELDLVKQIQRVERQIAWMEGQKEDMLQLRHRTRIAEEKGPNDSESSFYGTDADEDGVESLSWDDDTNAPTKKGLSVAKVVLLTFVTSIIVPADIALHFLYLAVQQVTLTHFFRRGEDCDREEESSGASVSGGTTTQDENNSEDDNTDWWADALLPTRPASLVLTTMNEYREATRKSESAVGGAWKRATATKREMNEDEGLCALTDLLDEAMHSSDSERFMGEQYELRGLDDGGDMHQPGAHLGHEERRRNDSQVQRGVLRLHDPMIADVIERMCPCWEENKEFLRNVTDQEDLKEALDAVTRGKRQMEEMFDGILDAFSRREQALTEGCTG
jgi:hypothetical protein